MSWGHDSDSGNFYDEEVELHEHKGTDMRQQIDNWKREGPYTFEAVLDLVGVLNAHRNPIVFDFSRDLDEVAHLFSPSDLSRLNGVCPEIRDARRLKAWIYATGGCWRYAGDPSLLSKQHLDVIAQSSDWARCLSTVQQRDRRQLLRLAASLNRARRDASPKPKGPTLRSKPTPRKVEAPRVRQPRRTTTTPRRD